MQQVEREYWDPRNELMSKSEIRIMQERKLRQAIHHAYHYSPFYRERFDQAGLEPDEICTLEDINKIPLLDKYMLRDATQERAARGQRPFHGIATVPETDFVTVHTTSGTTGVPYTEPFTEIELTRQGFIASGDFSARAYWSFGLRPGDIIIHLWNLGGAMVGGGNHIMAKGGCSPELFLTLIPGHVGNTRDIIRMMKEVGATALISTPSYSQYLPEVAERMGIDVRQDLNIRVVICAGEPGPASVPGLRQKLSELWDAEVFDQYGAPGVMVASECQARCGFHIQSDYVYVQVVDPETKEELPPGEMGSIVATKLGTPAMPFIRFDTEDRGALLVEPCLCGRSHPRISSVPGRWDDVIKIKGFRFYPDTIEKVAKETPGCTGEFVIFLEKDTKGRDKVRIRLEYAPQMEDPERFREKLAHDIITLITLKADVELVPEGEISRFVMKAQRVVDIRTEEARQKYLEGAKIRSAKFFD